MAENPGLYALSYDLLLLLFDWKVRMIVSATPSGYAVHSAMQGLGGFGSTTLSFSALLLRAADRYRSCDCGSTAYSTIKEDLPRTYRHRETLINRSSYLFHSNWSLSS